MPHLPKMDLRFLRNVPGERGGTAAVFIFADPKGTVGIAMTVEMGKEGVVSEAAKRVNAYPQLLGLIDRMAAALDPTAQIPDKNVRSLIQEARDVLGIT